MIHSIFNENDKNFKLSTFRKITYLLNKISLFCDFAFTDEDGYNRHLNPGCVDVIFHHIESGDIHLRINIHSLEIESTPEVEKYIDLIKSIIYNKIDYIQIDREIKLISILD
jgi:hypothetical protein